MESRLLEAIDRYFLTPQAAFLRHLDEAVGSQRGPRLLPVRALLAGIIYVGLEPGPITQTRLAKFFHSATEGQLRRIYGLPLGATHQHLPAPPAPSRDQLYRTFEASRRRVWGGRIRLANEVVVSWPRPSDIGSGKKIRLLNS